MTSRSCLRTPEKRSRHLLLKMPLEMRRIFDQLREKMTTRQLSLKTHSRANLRLLQIFCTVAFGIIGSLTRIGLGELFGPDFGDVTSPNSALFVDLPANAFGCFVLGFLIGSDDAFRPRLPYVHIGLATGLSGAVTTYAGWNQHVVALFCSGDLLWVRALFALVIGLEVALFSFKLGLHSEMALRHTLTRHRRRHDPFYREAYQRYREAKTRVEALNAYHSSIIPRITPFRRVFAQDRLESARDDLVSRQKGLARHGRRSREGDIEIPAGQNGNVSGHVEETDTAEPQSQRATATPSRSTTDRIRRSIDRPADVINGLAEALAMLQGGHDRWGYERVLTAVSRRSTHHSFAIALLGSASLLAGGIVGVILDTDVTRRGYWVAVCVSPFGLFARFLLSQRLNGVKRFHPVGTFVGNMFASAILAALSGTLLRIEKSNSARFWMLGVATGFGGSLSTVSTFVAELHQARRLQQAYAYTFISLCGSVVLGVAIYGPLLWTSEDARTPLTISN